MSGTVLGVGDIAMKKAEKTHFHDIYVLMGIQLQTKETNAQARNRSASDSCREFKYDYMANSDRVAAFEGRSEKDSLRR